MSLFDASEEANRRAAQPLAARMRPATLDEFVGQQHFLGEGKLLRRLLAADRLGSVIFYGPPGTGKTTLARLLARESRSHFQQLSAVASGVKELREILAAAHDRLSAAGQRTLLFVDEIHRFNKAQQDVLLPGVEEGVVILVGATTENPFFTINSPLVSRSRVFQFEPLSNEDIKTLLRRAAADRERGLGSRQIRLHDDALEFLAETSDGDARRALSALEVGVLSSRDAPVEFTRAVGRRVGAAEGGAIRPPGRRPLRLDQRLIKSIRGSDPDAGLVLAGPDARRGRRRAFPRPAAGDPGQRGRGQRRPGRPAAGRGRRPGLRTGRPAGVPIRPGPGRHLPGLCAEIQRGDGRHRRGPPRRPRRPAAAGAGPFARSDYGGAKRLGHGQSYQYAHNEPDAVAAQDYLGVEREYYRPVDRGFEQELAKRLAAIRAGLREGRPQ